MGEVAEITIFPTMQFAGKKAVFYLLFQRSRAQRPPGAPGNAAIFWSLVVSRWSLDFRPAVRYTVIPVSRYPVNNRGRSVYRYPGIPLYRRRIRGRRDQPWWPVCAGLLSYFITYSRNFRRFSRYTVIPLNRRL